MTKEFCRFERRRGTELPPARARKTSMLEQIQILVLTARADELSLPLRHFDDGSVQASLRVGMTQARHPVRELRPRMS